MHKKFILIFLLSAFLFCSFTCLAYADTTDSVRAVPSDGEHWYRILSIYHPDKYTQFNISGRIRSSGKDFTFFAAYPTSEYYNTAFQGVLTQAFVGDVFVFTAEQLQSASEDVLKLLQDEQYFLEISFEPDDTSVFRNIRSTLSYYVFNDNFDNVPFGTGVVDFAAGFLCILLFCLPFVVVYFILGRILRG